MSRKDDFCVPSVAPRHATCVSALGHALFRRPSLLSAPFQPPWDGVCAGARARVAPDKNSARKIPLRAQRPHSLFRFLFSADDSDDDWENDDLPDKLKLGTKDEKEEWSDEEGHDAHLQPVEEKKEPPKPQAPKPKTGLQLKIEEREKKEHEEAERKAAIRKELGHDDDVDVSDMDAATAEKMRRKKAEEAADLDSAIDAFGVAGVADAPKPKAKAAAAAPPPAKPVVDARTAARDAAALGGATMETFEAKSDEEFEKLAKLINEKLKPSEGSKVRVLHTHVQATCKRC